MAAVMTPRALHTGGGSGKSEVRSSKMAGSGRNGGKLHNSAFRRGCKVREGRGLDLSVSINESNSSFLVHLTLVGA